VLLDVAPNFFDASLVPWIAGTLRRMKGDADDLDPIRERAMEATLKLATASQVKILDEIARTKLAEGTLGQEYEKEINLAKELLGRCAAGVDCYLATLTDPQVNSDDKQAMGIKAAYQIGVLGNADVRAKIIDAYPRITQPAIRFAALTVVDALSPKGDRGIARQLQKIVDDATASKDMDRIRFNPTVKQFIYRLEARAEP
jgi:hypothetical protein